MSSLTATIAFRVSFSVTDDPRKWVVGFNHRTNKRGNDFAVWANKGYTSHNADSVFLKFVIDKLLSDVSGVERIHVTPVTLTIIGSNAVDFGYLRQLVLEGLALAGIDYTEVNR